MKHKKGVTISGKATQRKVAIACGVSQQAVCFWIKNGRVPAKRIRKFSSVTGISEAYLYELLFCEDEKEGDDEHN